MNRMISLYGVLKFRIKKYIHNSPVKLNSRCPILHATGICSKLISKSRYLNILLNFTNSLKNKDILSFCYDFIHLIFIDTAIALMESTKSLNSFSFKD